MPGTAPAAVPSKSLTQNQFRPVAQFREQSPGPRLDLAAGTLKHLQHQRPRPGPGLHPFSEKSNWHRNRRIQNQKFLRHEICEYVEAIQRESGAPVRSEEHTSELQSHSFISYAVFCLKKKNLQTTICLISQTKSQIWSECV